jgi:hypothetical protein
MDPAGQPLVAEIAEQDVELSDDLPLDTASAALEPPLPGK